MSIASEINDLDTNLTAAKNAVTTQGGITGDTGLAGLASEIATIPTGGGGGVTILTEDDYNYPTSGTATTIALWLLDPGVYCIQYTNGNRPSIKFLPGGADQNFGDGELFIVFGKGSLNSSNREVLRIIDQNTTDYYPQINRLNGGSSKTYYLLLDNNVIDNLTSSNISYYPLSAKQGYVLDKKIDDRIIQKASAPTTSTVGVLGQLYTDTTNMHTYQCTAISGSTYTWTQRW